MQYIRRLTFASCFVVFFVVKDKSLDIDSVVPALLRPAGIAAGATQAALTQHFALANNAADINAKRAARGNVTAIVGMVAGMALTKVSWNAMQSIQPAVCMPVYISVVRLPFEVVETCITCTLVPC